jgi:hypothetical protein
MNVMHTSRIQRSLFHQKKETRRSGDCLLNGGAQHVLRSRASCMRLTFQRSVSLSSNMSTRMDWWFMVE